MPVQNYLSGDTAVKIARGVEEALADGRRGTRICPAPPVAALTAAPLPAGVRDLSEGNPDPTLLPDVERIVRTLPVPPRVYGDELNDPGLLALAKEQFAADRVPAEHV